MSLAGKQREEMSKLLGDNGFCTLNNMEDRVNAVQFIFKDV